MSELKPCPFCGGTDIEYHYQGSSDWSFECNGCPVHASFWVRLKKDEDWDEVKEGDETGEHARAIQYWNTRAEKPNKHTDIDDPNPSVWNWKNTNNGALWGTPRDNLSQNRDKE